jgi:hypothetical protein
MSVGVKGILIEIGFWCTSVACAVYWVKVPSQGWLAGKVWLSAFVIFATWLSTLNCPRCGHNVTSRPLKWLHDFPMVVAGDVFHRRCRWCGYDLRAEPDYMRRHKGSR